jgi:hypothetical protein
MSHADFIHSGIASSLPLREGRQLMSAWSVMKDSSAAQLFSIYLLAADHDSHGLRALRNEARYSLLNFIVAAKCRSSC